MPAGFTFDLSRSRCDARRALPKHMAGASLTEFVIVGPIAILFTFVILQAGLLYMAKLTLNNATFMAARAGATQNASKTEIRNSLLKGLIPFYQNATNTNDFTRLTAAAFEVGKNSLLDVKLEVLSPSAEAFNVYGITVAGVTYIPNDNLEFRLPTPQGGASISIRDANILRIKVTYGYELKVPLMGAIVKRLMGFGAPGSDVRAWDRFSVLPSGSLGDCTYYLRNRVPIVSYATVQMQSRAEQ